MLILANNGNWEKSQRESTELPEVHIDGGTVFLPVNVREITVSVAKHAESGTEGIEEVAGYAFDEYRINHPIGLPKDAMDAYQAALVFFAEAYQRNYSE